MSETIQVVKVGEGIECEAVASLPGFGDGEYAITVKSKVPLDTLTMHGDLMLVPVGDVLTLTEQTDGEDYWFGPLGVTDE